jgi:hypothetical protein
MKVAFAASAEMGFVVDGARGRLLAGGGDRLAGVKMVSAWPW